MKPFTRRTIFIFSSKSHFLNPTTISEINNQSLFRISHFSTSQNPHHSWHSSSYQSRRHEEESRNVRVSVWWDFENCSLPAGANVFRASQSITAAIRANGIKGPIQITAFGDVLQLSRSNQEALTSTGINLTHIPHGGKNSADRSLLVDLMYWVSQNPPPAHLFLISGDRDFASILHRLRMTNYNILLASPDSAPGVLCSAASIMWHWNDLIKGENLNGKHFNQPPDGPHGSWYGHYRLPLEDPFAVTDQQPSSKAENVSESGSDLKVRPVPKAVVKQIRLILNSYPKGISVTELRMELGKSNVTVDKDFYGYKKFSRFLLSMPHVLKLQTGNEGQHFVRSVAPKVTETSECTPGPTNGDPLIVNSHGGPGSGTGGAPDEKPSVSSSPKVIAKESLTKMEEPRKKEPGPPSVVENVNDNNKGTVSDLQPAEEQDPISQAGFFRRIWRNWFGGKENDSTLSQCTENVKETEKKHVEFTSEGADIVGPGSICKSGNGEITDKNNLRDNDVVDDSSSKDPSLFKHIMTRCRFWRSSQPSGNLSENSEKVDRINIENEKHEIFSKESFWVEILAFIDSPKGSELVLQSRTRKQMAQNLQNQGPSILKSLSETNLLHLIDLLISDKKRVEESPSQTFPFKLNKSTAENSSSTNLPTSNGLRSLFSSTSSRSPDCEIRHQNLPHSGVSPREFPKKPTGKSREEILADCQKLVDGIVKDYPEGFNMGLFRKYFLDKYGYSLDLQKIGHQKLATLLQTMSGVKIESSYIIPSFKLSRENARENNDSDLSDAQWDELGPVSKNSPEGNEIGLGQRREEPKYELLTDDEFSDSDEETSSSVVGPEGRGKSRMNEEDSSLLQILDSWYSSQEDNNKQCEKNDLKQPPPPPSLSEIGINGENPAVSYGRKQRSSRSYSFVADQKLNGDNKDKLIDGILGSLKKSSVDRSGESTVHS